MKDYEVKGSVFRPNASLKWEDWENTPVPRPDKEYADEESVFTGLQEKGDWEYSKEYLEDYAYELQESRNAGYNVMDFQEWCAMEEFFGQRICLEDFESLKSFYDFHEDVDGNILELGGDDPIIEAFRKGDKVFFSCSDSDCDAVDAEVIIEGLLTSKECDMNEVGPMYRVKLEDGRKMHAFYDELHR